MSGVAAIILAAGESQRMGRPKLLLPLDDVSVIRTMANRVISAGLDPVIVVVGTQDVAIRRELAGLEISFVSNPDGSSPTSTSLHLGLNLVPESCEAAMVILPDMVRVTDAMISKVRHAGCDSAAPLAVSRYGDVFAPPLFFRRRLFPELLAWHGEGCGKQVVLRHQQEAVILDWPPNLLGDIDTPEAYQTFRSEIGR